MQEERMAILQMVAEKKITAEEAAQLLEALGSSEPPVDRPDEQNQQERHQDYSGYRRSRRSHSRKHRKSSKYQSDWQGRLNDLSNNLSSLFGDMGGIFGKQGVSGDHGDFSFGQSSSQDQFIEVKEGTEIEVDNTAGKLTVKGCDEDRMRVKSTGFKTRHIQVDEEANEIHIDALGQSMTLDIPRQAAVLKLNTTGGKLSVEDIQANCDIQITGGWMQGHGLQGNHQIGVTGGTATLDAITSSDLIAKLQGGSLKLQMDKVSEGQIDIQIHGGHGILLLPADADCTIDITAERSYIISNIPGDHEKEDHKASFHGVCGNGEATIRIEAHRGHVEVNIDE